MFQPDAKKFYNPDGYDRRRFIEYEKLFKPGMQDLAIWTIRIISKG